MSLIVSTIWYLAEQYLGKDVWQFFHILRVLNDPQEQAQHHRTADLLS